MEDAFALEDEVGIRQQVLAFDGAEEGSLGWRFGSGDRRLARTPP